MPSRYILVPCAVLCFCSPARAQDPFTQLSREKTQIKVFIPVYDRYIKLMKTQGIAGLKTIATTDFTLKWGKEVRTGAAAFEELKKYVPDPPQNGAQDAISVTLRRLTIIATRPLYKPGKRVHFI